jgi:hypothetical protein
MLAIMGKRMRDVLARHVDNGWVPGVVSLLPELAGRTVLRRIDAPLDDTVPAVRPITVRDLLTFVLGFGLRFDPTAARARPGGTTLPRT